MPKRLLEIAKLLNVSTKTIVEYLHKNGYEDITEKPTAKIPEETYDALVEEFATTPDIKEKAKKMLTDHTNDQSQSCLKPWERSSVANEQLSGPKILGKINLNALNKNNHLNFVKKQKDISIKQIKKQETPTIQGLKILSKIELNKRKLNTKRVEKYNKKNILDYEKYNKKFEVFRDLEDNEIQQELSIVELKFNDFIYSIKKQHQAELQAELNALLKYFEIKVFLELDSLQEFNIKAQSIIDDLFEDYIDLHKALTNFKNKIKAEEKRIKDEILAKTYIIDTNVFIEEPDIISKIDTKDFIALTLTVVDELDKLKTKEKTKEKAVKAIKNINEALQKSNNQKKARIKKAKANLTLLPEELQKKSGDNYLLSMAIVYKDENPIILTIDKNLQSKAMILNITVLTLKEFLGEKTDTKINSSNSNGIDYKSIFNEMKPDKNGKYQISSFISILKKQNTEFDYKALGFEKAWHFVESLGDFEVSEKQFLNLKK